MKESFALYVENPLVRENLFKTAEPDYSAPPAFEDVRDLLPKPFWLDHETTIECYWKSWEIAFSNLLPASPANGFVSPYLDTAFNGHLFMWDSAFAMQFAMYGSRAFNFQRTLDNLYCKQHPDGFICREIDEADGKDCFQRFDPSSTGPNVLPWAEWNYFVRFGDRERLARVFPVLLAYSQWLQTYRTWLDGSYWSTGWGCGMDNLPRLEPGYHPAFSHGRMVWLDATLQAILAADILCKMGQVRRAHSVESLYLEAEYLKRWVNENLWDEQTGFITTAMPMEARGVKHRRILGALPAPLAGAARTLHCHLDDPAEFNRPHRIRRWYQPSSIILLAIMERRRRSDQLHDAEGTAGERFGALAHTSPEITWQMWFGSLKIRQQCGKIMLRAAPGARPNPISSAGRPARYRGDARRSVDCSRRAHRTLQWDVRRWTSTA